MRAMAAASPLWMERITMNSRLMAPRTGTRWRLSSILVGGFRLEAGGRAASMTELGERALARIAMRAMVVQPDAAMRAEVIGRVLQVDRPFATGADALGQPRQRQVIAELLAALHVRHLFGLLLPLQVTVQRYDRLSSDQYRDDDADQVAHITAVAGQVGHQLDEEGK